MRLEVTAGPGDTLAPMPNDLIGLTEVAALFGVTKMTASRYANRDDFPAPTQELARGRLWSEKQVKAWSAKSGLPKKAKERR
jgi:predicted DNA-binding transcriptional regulator AlpA